ncbi:non-ribosomal peptide synthetase, partial [Amycolatopsis sp. NPDC000673]|uniref:non-ribosomal peptide synthetase n=1 Tax=Amycolatopsis sp. NPDC000673 TaxID=3154267 RepID=UPI0033248D1D
AVLHRGRAMSYARLDLLADRLAARLAALGVAGTVLGICAERSFALPLAILATLKAGAAYLPLDPGLPAERTAFMAADAGVRVLVARPEAARRLGMPAGITVVDPDQAPEGAPPEPVRVPVSPDDLAYVMYTSGSTGVPKGVAMPHGPVASLVEWQRGDSAAGETDRTLQFSAAGFDASFQEMFSTWSTGGCLVLVADEIRRDSGRLLGFLTENRITRLFLPFVALQALANAAHARDAYPTLLREVITAGEQLVVTPSLRRFFQQLRGTRLCNQYGPSETHIVTSTRLAADPGSWPELPPIGRPIDGARIEVLDEHGAPLPPGTTGELHIGGPVLARGYLNRPRLSAERFVPDPSGPPGGRAYRTGDLGQVDANGEVLFSGRADNQVKIRGHRVEPGEVEVAVKALAGLTDAVVVAHRDPVAGVRLIAYVLAGDRAAPPDLRAQLERKLPEHLVPVAFVAVPRFPLTANGKVDRRALAERPVTISGSGREARDRVEEALLESWGRTLNAVEVGVDDSFFHLGGNSLHAAALLTDLNERFGVEASLEKLFERPTVAAFAEWIRESRGEAAE